ncbi:hypothetical protein LAV60_15545 [Clostridium sporogenes]|uniref:hypothetical protein n=1 Tax=Clostridium sporogenes TaxID=1509 RepID=UPI002237BEAC|nr:hypothetical protein [Clostridium sporogenes]MCW6094585.1 hypothetical protein [Clostridium sporogenes]
MKNIQDLLERYEFLEVFNENTTDVVMDIYAELIDKGVLSDEIGDKDFIMDYLLNEVKYEFAGEDILDELADELTIIALMDSIPDNLILNMAEAISEIEQNNEEEHEKLSTKSHIVISIEFDTQTGIKETAIVGHTFNTIDDVQKYVDKIGLGQALDNVLYGKDQDTGCTGMLPVKEAKEILSNLEIEDLLLNDGIINSASTISTLVTTNKDRDKLINCQMFAVFEGTVY